MLSAAVCQYRSSSGPKLPKGYKGASGANVYLKGLTFRIQGFLASRTPVLRQIPLPICLKAFGGWSMQSVWRYQSCDGERGRATFVAYLAGNVNDKDHGPSGHAVDEPSCLFIGDLRQRLPTSSRYCCKSLFGTLSGARKWP